MTAKPTTTVQVSLLILKELRALTQAVTGLYDIRRSVVGPAFRLLTAC
jgi:hypothetical protein